MANPILTRAIDALASRRDLSSEQTAEVLSVIMHGDASEIEISAFLIALRTKGETVEELAGLASTMRALAAPVSSSREDLLDTSGTGGGRPTFNVSTTAALIAAGAGCAVAKHGNRSATGKSGSADLLEALGARIDLDAAQVGRCIDEVGFGFMFAPAHHQATRYVVPVRAGLAVRTVFNLLGPLTNPAGARRQLIGVSDPSVLDRVAGALARLGVDRALVVCSVDGLDEISVFAPTTVFEVQGSELTSYTLQPSEVGIELQDGETAAGTPAENARLARAILEGMQGPEAELVIVNAGAAIYVGGLASSIAEGVGIAREAIADGRALAALERYVAASHGARSPVPGPRDRAVAADRPAGARAEVAP